MLACIMWTTCQNCTHTYKCIQKIQWTHFTILYLYMNSLSIYVYNKIYNNTVIICRLYIYVYIYIYSNMSVKVFYCTLCILNVHLTTMITTSIPNTKQWHPKHQVDLGARQQHICSFAWKENTMAAAKPADLSNILCLCQSIICLRSIAWTYNCMDILDGWYIHRKRTLMLKPHHLWIDHFPIQFSHL